VGLQKLPGGEFTKAEEAEAPPMPELNGPTVDFKSLFDSWRDKPNGNIVTVTPIKRYCCLHLGVTVFCGLF
jgi:hypothetical protein